MHGGPYVNAKVLQGKTKSSEWEHKSTALEYCSLFFNNHGPSRAPSTYLTVGIGDLQFSKYKLILCMCVSKNKPHTSSGNQLTEMDIISSWLHSIFRSHRGCFKN